MRTDSDAETDDFIIRWRKSKQTRGVHGELQWSPNLQGWNVSGTGPVDSLAPPQWQERIVREEADHFVMEAQIPTGGRARMFVRLMVMKK